MKSWTRCASLIAVLISASGLQAQSTTYYVTDGDAATGFIIQNGALIDTFSTTDVPGGRGYAIAVRDTILLGDVDDGGGAEYTLGGVFTGNTFSGGNGFSQLLDGTTDGTSNYASLFSGDGTVVVADQNWEGATVLLDLQFSSVGITYDPTDNTLFIVDDDTRIIRHFTLAGGELGSFDPSLGRPCCLAYEAATDTLWMADNNNNEVIYQFTKTGTLLDTVTVTGLTGNYFGGEMAQEGVFVPPRSAPEIPTLDHVGLAVLAASIAAAAALLLVRARRG